MGDLAAAVHGIAPSTSTKELPRRNIARVNNLLLVFTIVVTRATTRAPRDRHLTALR
jgi:hypothetical protein